MPAAMAGGTGGLRLGSRQKGLYLSLFQIARLLDQRDPAFHIRRASIPESGEN